MIEQNEHDTPMHKWERIEAQLERVWPELKESNETNLVLQRSQMDLCQERDWLKAELEHLRTWASKTHDELQHQSQLRQQWHAVARELFERVRSIYPADMEQADLDAMNSYKAMDCKV